MSESSPHLTWNIISDINQMFSFHFMTNALIAGSIVAVIAGTIGWFMVLRKQTFAGHTLAVVGFPGAAGATLLGIPLALGYFGLCTTAALIIAAIPRTQQGAARSQESSVIGTIQAFALACGLLFINLYKGFLNSIDSLLFGNFLGISDAQVMTILGVAIIVLVTMGVIGRPLFFASVDNDVAAARGVPTRALSIVFLVVLGAAVAEVSQITGSLLVFALLVMPASTAQCLSGRPSFTLPLTVLISLGVTWLGLGASYFSPYPVGFCLTTFAFAAFVIARLSRYFLELGRNRLEVFAL
jgi:zinc/manganese transport system permease protein